MRTAVAILVIVLPTLAACGGSKGSVNCSDVVHSPGGAFPKACVHEVPNGATVAFGDGGTTIVSVNGKVVTTYPPCPCTSMGTGMSTCSDRNGIAHAVGSSWTDGCMSCSCSNLGGTLSPVCTHTTCPPDASVDGRDGSGDDGASAEAHLSVDSAQCQSLITAYDTAYAAATACAVDAGGQCGTMITRPFACRCASFVNGSADSVNAAAVSWTDSGCTDFCNGACALATHAVCVADSTSPTGGRCANRDVASDPP